MKNQRELFEYYNERAPEYEDAYLGKFAVKTSHSDLYKNDTLAIQKVLPGYISGKCIDIACGTGFWLPVYEKDCTSITLIDQSENVLAECAKKIGKLGIEEKTKIIRDEILSYPFKEHEYDSAFIGFFISHLPDAELDAFFGILKRLLRPGGRLTVIDGVWSEMIIKIRPVRSKVGMITRTLYDGRQFQVFKRYFEKQDLQDLAGRFGINLDIIYWGKVFLLATGHFRDA